MFLYEYTISHVVDRLMCIKKIFLFALLMQFLVVLCKENHYGRVMQARKDAVEGSIVESVEIYPQKAINSKSRIMRKGLLVRHPNAIATIVICHGFMCDRFDSGFLRVVFPREKYNFLTFDFRAHGANIQGQRCTLGRDEALDVTAAVKFLKENPNIDNRLPIIGFGFSMGAVASIEAQASQPLFDAMILDCPFDSCENLIKRSLNNVKFNFLGYQFSLPGQQLLQKYAFHPYVQSLIKVIVKAIAQLDPQDVNVFMCPVDTVKSIKKITVPCFFICCKHDALVTIEAIKSVYRSSSGAKRLWLTNGRRHFDSYFYSPELYGKKVEEFIDHVLNNTIEQQDQGIIEDPDEA